MLVPSRYGPLELSCTDPLFSPTWIDNSHIFVVNEARSMDLWNARSMSPSQQLSLLSAAYFTSLSPLPSTQCGPFDDRYCFHEVNGREPVHDGIEYTRECLYLKLGTRK